MKNLKPILALLLAWPGLALAQMNFGGQANFGTGGVPYVGGQQMGYPQQQMYPQGGIQANGQMMQQPMMGQQAMQYPQQAGQYTNSVLPQQVYTGGRQMGEQSAMNGAGSNGCTTPRAAQTRMLPDGTQVDQNGNVVH